MSLFGKIRGEFVDIIEWMDDSRNTMVHRFERMGNEIKYGAKLVTREGQAAVFVNEGELADVFGPGTYTLETKNVPILSTLQNWKHGFESPFKAEVYFVNTRRFTDQKWGTKNPIMLRDPEFGPIRLRAFGSYAFRVSDPAVFLKEIVGTDSHFTQEDITAELRNKIVARFTDILGEKRIPALDLAANYDEFAGYVSDRLHDEFSAYGLDLTSLLIENISLPPEVEKALDKRTSMGVIGNLQQYLQYQAAESMEKAAENPSGMGAGGMSMGMGFGVAQQMAQAFQQPGQAAPQQAPPPIPQALVYHVASDGTQTGPFDLATLKQKAMSGEFTAETLVWAPGMAEWKKAGDVSDLSAVFTQVPPPVPPPNAS